MAWILWWKGLIYSFKNKHLITFEVDTLYLRDIHLKLADNPKPKSSSGFAAETAWDI